MKNKRCKKRTSTFFITVAIWVVIGSCGGDNPSDSDPESEFDFSDDLIAFRSDRDGSDDIWLMTPDGSELINITPDPVNDSDPAWSPDGSTIYFFSTRDGFGGIWEMESDCTGGTNLVKLTVEFEFSCAPGIGWSLVDSQVKLSFVGKTTPSSSKKSGVTMTRDSGQQGDQYDNWVMDLDGSNKMNVTNHPGTDWSSTWSDDGDNLIFDTDRNDNWDIYSVGEEGSGLTLLTDHPADDRYPAWRPG